MKTRIIAAIVLAAAVCGLFWLSMEKREEYRLKLTAYEQAYEQVEQQTLLVQEKQALLDALTTEKADGLAADAQNLEQEAVRLEKEIAELRTQIGNIQSALDNPTPEQLEKKEEMDYLDQVYQALQEGYEKVKGYIAGN